MRVAELKQLQKLNSKATDEERKALNKVVRRAQHYEKNSFCVGFATLVGIALWASCLAMFITWLLMI